MDYIRTVIRNVMTLKVINGLYGDYYLAINLKMPKCANILRQIEKKKYIERIDSIWVVGMLIHLWVLISCNACCCGREAYFHIWVLKMISKWINIINNVQYMDNLMDIIRFFITYLTNNVWGTIYAWTKIYNCNLKWWINQVKYIYSERFYCLIRYRLFTSFH